MRFDRRRSELEARSSAPPRFTQLSTMTTNLLNLTHTTRQRFGSSRWRIQPESISYSSESDS